MISGQRIAFARQRRHTFLNERVKPVQIDRFNEVMLESRSVTFTNIIFHSKTRESNSKNWPFGVQRLQNEVWVWNPIIGTL